MWCGGSFNRTIFIRNMKDYFHGQSFDINKSAGRHLIGQINICSPFSVEGFSPYIAALRLL